MFLKKLMKKLTIWINDYLVDYIAVSLILITEIIKNFWI